MPDAHDDPTTGAAPSKSELKRRMTALQELGETLAELGERQLEQMPIDDARLLEALREVRGIRSHSARKRHLQYIGKLMREVDAEPLRRALEDLQGQQRQAAEVFHQLERLRDRLLDEGDEAIEAVLQRWPGADRQQLRQLVRQHRREQAQDRPPAAGRKLFRYLRTLQDEEADQP